MPKEFRKRLKHWIVKARKKKLFALLHILRMVADVRIRGI